MVVSSRIIEMISIIRRGRGVLGLASGSDVVDDEPQYIRCW